MYELTAQAPPSTPTHLHHHNILSRTVPNASLSSRTLTHLFPATVNPDNSQNSYRRPSPRSTSNQLVALLHPHNSSHRRSFRRTSNKPPSSNLTPATQSLRHRPTFQLWLLHSWVSSNASQNSFVLSPDQTPAWIYPRTISQGKISSLLKSHPINGANFHSFLLTVNV